MKSTDYVIGVDVGTSSVRAGLFSVDGTLIANNSHPIKLWKPQDDFVEQSSEDIWQSCCITIHNIVKESGINPSSIIGIGFDATCSLVVLGKDNKPVTVSPSKLDEQNVIVWMDHRAIGEAEEINTKNHAVLHYVGGKISPEMQTPKLLWLKRNLPDTWARAEKFFDLSDYLVYRATGVDVRSLCTTTCKWTYMGHESVNGSESIGSWDASYFNQIGLSDIVNDGFKKIGTRVRPVGESVGNGLTETSAKELGLFSGTSVGVSIIDAHAGGLGLLGCPIEDDTSLTDSRLVLVGGTSSCHLIVSDEPKFVPGVWGPYYSAMVPNLWMTEGGQSATGSLIDHIVFSSRISTEIIELAKQNTCSVYDILNQRLESMCEDKGGIQISQLTTDVHVLPYFLGNRSPRANPNLTGSISGMRLSANIDELALLYLATIQAIACGTRHIIETMNSSGYTISTILATGGGSKNKLFIAEHANITKCKIVLSDQPEAVLLGSAMIGSVAGNYYSSLNEAMVRMSKTGEIVYPNTNLNEFYDKKYKVFLTMYNHDMEYRSIMHG